MTKAHSPEGLIPTELVARLEAASVGSRELDDAVLRACGYDYRRELQRSFYSRSGEAGRLYGDGGSCVTTSLDAALALAERVLPGWRRHLNELPPNSGLGWEVTVWTDATDLLVHPSRAATAPLALCIAILKATTPASQAPSGDEPLGECTKKSGGQGNG